MSTSTPVLSHSTLEFVTIPETTLPNGAIVPEFKVGKYLTGRENEQLVINDRALPWDNILYGDARGEAKKAGLALLTERQHLAIAHNIANVAINWTGGAVGKGHLYQGLHLSLTEDVQPGNYVSKNGCERRWFELSNGDRIFDIAGNCYSFIFDDVQGDENGLVAEVFADNSPSITSAPAPSEVKGIGWFPVSGTHWIGEALVRGGRFGAGIFSLDFISPNNTTAGIGFRCTLP